MVTSRIGVLALSQPGDGMASLVRAGGALCAVEFAEGARSIIHMENYLAVFCPHLSPHLLPLLSPYLLSRRVSVKGHRSFKAHSEHLGAWAVQTARPWKTMQCESRVQFS